MGRNAVDRHRKVEKKKAKEKNRETRQAIRRSTLRSQDPKVLCEELDELEYSRGKFNEYVRVDKMKKLSSQLRKVLEFLEKEDEAAFKEYKTWESEFKCKSESKRRKIHQEQHAAARENANILKGTSSMNANNMVINDDDEDDVEEDPELAAIPLPPGTPPPLPEPEQPPQESAATIRPHDLMTPVHPHGYQFMPPHQSGMGMSMPPPRGLLLHPPPGFMPSMGVRPHMQQQQPYGQPRPMAGMMPVGMRPPGRGPPAMIVPREHIGTQQPQLPPSYSNNSPTVLTSTTPAPITATVPISSATSDAPANVKMETGNLSQFIPSTLLVQRKQKKVHQLKRPITTNNNMLTEAAPHVKPIPATTTSGKSKDAAYNDFMAEMTGII